MLSVRSIYYLEANFTHCNHDFSCSIILENIFNIEFNRRLEKCKLTFLWSAFHWIILIGLEFFYLIVKLTIKNGILRYHTRTVWFFAVGFAREPFECQIIKNVHFYRVYSNFLTQGLKKFIFECIWCLNNSFSS